VQDASVWLPVLRGRSSPYGTAQLHCLPPAARIYKHRFRAKIRVFAAFIFVIFLLPSLQVCNPAYLVPSQARINREGCGMNGIWHKIGGDVEDGGVSGPDRVTSSRTVGALASIIFPTPHKIQNDDRLPQHVSGVSGWMCLLVPAHPGSPGQRAVKRQCVCVLCYRSLHHSKLATSPMSAREICLYHIATRVAQQKSSYQSDGHTTLKTCRIHFHSQIRTITTMTNIYVCRLLIEDGKLTKRIEFIGSKTFRWEIQHRDSDIMAAAWTSSCSWWSEL